MANKRTAVCQATIACATPTPRCCAADHHHTAAADHHHIAASVHIPSPRPSLTSRRLFSVVTKDCLIMPLMSSIMRRWLADPGGSYQGHAAGQGKQTLHQDLSSTYTSG